MYVPLCIWFRNEAADNKTTASFIVSFSLLVFIHDPPKQKERTSAFREHTHRLCIQSHWNLTTPGISAGCPHLLRRHAMLRIAADSRISFANLQSNLLEVSLQRSTLWPDRSIIVALACRRPTADAPLLHEINARSAHRLITGSERNVVCVLYYSVVNEQLRADSGAKRFFPHMYRGRSRRFNNLFS